MKQPHTEETIKHTEDEQNTGNHKKPGVEDAKGADKFGGTRSGAETLEPGGSLHEQAPEKDERGRQ